MTDQAPETVRVNRPTEILTHIQALRALAVGIVVIYHVWPGALPGGFIGVDVFFVISGFLITAHLMRDVERHGTVSLPSFYARRARRLLPAAMLVIAATAVAVVAWFPITRWVSVFREVAASAFYVENWALAAKSTNYLELNAAPSPLQHYWSLSVEEQFYLVWPVLIIVAVLIARRAKLPAIVVARIVLAVVVVASLVYGVWLTFNEPPLAYFSTFVRAWEFGGGALLALWRPKRAFSPAVGTALGVTAFVGLAVMSFAYDGSTPFPGFAAIGIVVATVAALAAGTPHPAPLRAIVEWRPVQFLGDISYSVYLWHWPILIIAPYALGHALGLPESIGVVAVTLLLAWLSKRFVEDPVRRWPPLAAARARRTLVLMLAVMVAFAGVSVLATRYVSARIQAAQAETEKGNPDPVTGLRPAPIAAADDVERTDKCWSPETTAEVVPCEYPSGVEGAPTVALVGDSHAEALSGAIVALAKERGWDLTTYLKQACSWGDGPMVKPGADFAQKCATYRESIQSLLEDKGYDAVITTSAVYRVAPGNQAEGFVAAWTPIEQSGTDVYVIADNPTWASDPVECLVLHERTPTSCDMTRDEAYPWEDPQVEAAAEVPGVSVIDLSPSYCDDDTCFATRDGYTIYRDTDHFTKTFARSLTPALDKALEDAGFAR